MGGAFSIAQGGRGPGGPGRGPLLLALDSEVRFFHLCFVVRPFSLRPEGW